MTAFAELIAATNFSFLRGASHAHEMVEQAAELGLAAIGVADRNTLAGVVRAHEAAKEHKIRLIAGARLVTTEGFEAVCYPIDRAGGYRDGFRDHVSFRQPLLPAAGNRRGFLAYAGARQLLVGRRPAHR